VAGENVFIILHIIELFKSENHTVSGRKACT